MCTTSGRSAASSSSGVRIALDPRHNASHRSLGDLRGICHRDQLGTGASQDRAGMVLGMTTGAEERNLKTGR